MAMHAIRRPRFLSEAWIAIIVAALIGFGALAGSTVTGKTAQGASPAFGVYLQPEGVATDSQLPIGAIQEAERARGFINVTTVDDLVERVEATNPLSIWIHAAALDDVPAAWLQSQKAQGTVVVGIDMSPADLDRVLNIPKPELASSTWNPEQYLTWVIYVEVRGVQYTNEHGEPASLSLSMFNNLRFQDPEDPGTLLLNVNRCIDEVQEALSYSGIIAE